MAKSLICQLLLPFLLNHQLCNCEFTYTSVAPIRIIPGSPFRISTTLESVDDSSSPVTFKYELTTNAIPAIPLPLNETIVASEEIKLSEPGNKVTILTVKSESLKSHDSFNLVVTATDSQGKVEHDRIQISKDVRDTSILIQTDKPIYKPGETVKFRVLLLNRFLQPFGVDKPVAVTITDPMGNVIKLWKSKVIPGGKGFTSEEFELSKEPNLGSWGIRVQHEMEQDYHYFSVEEYVLPKYKVEINLSPKFITYNDSKFTAEVSAMYSYGKPVPGECTVQLTDPNSYHYYHHYGHHIGKRRILSYPYHPPQYQNPTNPGITKTSKLEEGKGVAKIEFDPKTELNVIQQHVNKWGKDFNLFASCKDTASGNVRNATGTIRMYEFPYKIEMVKQPNHITPGFPFNITIKVVDHDNKPFQDVREDALKITHSFGDDGEMTTGIPPNGLVHLSFMASPNPKVCYESLDVTYKLLKEQLWLSGKQISPTGSYMQIKLLTESPVEGQPIHVNVKTSKVYQAINVFLISRGIVAHSEAIKGDGGKEQIVSVTLPPKSSPNAKLFIYVVFNDHNIVSDNLELKVNPDEKDCLEISMSEKMAEPGHNISISLKGRPNSIIALRAVDQSVLLLKKDDDLTLEKLGRLGDRFYLGGYGYWGMGQVFQHFIQNGLGLMTNIKIDRGQHIGVHYPQPMPMMAMAGTSMGMAARGSFADHAISASSAAAPIMATETMSFSGAGAVGPGPEVRVRSFFPETWIWEDLENKDGSITVQKTVPDTITSWLISAFQVDPAHGLGLSREASNITVFRPFFISLNLPYSVVKGELLLLQVLVHNYMEKSVKATVTLNNQDDAFKFLDAEDTFDKMDKKVKIKAGGIASVVYPIMPTKFGIITFKLKAVTKEAGDAISQTLIVKPPGIKHTQNSAILVNLLNNDTFKARKLTAKFPEQRVPDADFLKVQVIGDVLGGALNNLDHLIKLPTGCAEQNMLNFVPDIVILDYLHVSGQLLPEIEAKAKRYLASGYQRQLSYIRYDGSYSAFGNSDHMGSTWLTAYVTRAFIQAKRHVHIDDQVILRSLRFLMMQQNDNGSFSEQGFVIYQHLQGGVRGSKNLVAITAYALLAIAEAQKADMKVDGIVRRYGEAPMNIGKVMLSGVDYLINQTSGGQTPFTDVYSANLIAYLLHYIDHPKKDHFFQMIEGFAKVNPSNGTIHWKQIQKQEGLHHPWSRYHYMIWQPQVAPATVEMTSYGLLTYLLRGKDKLSDAVSIAKWLIRQRNSYGGFMSSQDTVMGITALSKFAEAINTKENLEANIKVRLSFGESDKHTFHIGKDNRTVLQEYLLPQNTKKVSIKGSGKGTALAQLTWTYYVEVVDLSPAFHLKAELKERDKGRNLDMKIEFAYNRTGQSNMAILEASTPSGYAFDQEELESLKQRQVFKRYELEDKDSKLQLYFESVDKNMKTLNLKAYRIYLVAKHCKGVVKMYDYYDNTQTAQFIYDVPVISICDICSVDIFCELKECKK